MNLNKVQELRTLISRLEWSIPSDQEQIVTLEKELEELLNESQ